jgi:hypothetical protein
MVRPQQVIDLWRDGERRLRAAEPGDRAVLERVRDEIVIGLQRRLGGPFTTDELASFYLSEGTDWAFEIATRVAPMTPEAWDMNTVANAAFARYVRRAIDYAGGRATEN